MKQEEQPLPQLHCNIWHRSHDWHLDDFDWHEQVFWQLWHLDVWHD